MLILKSLHLENFMLHWDTLLDLDSRSIFIEGRNFDSGMDSNGAGKSQLAEALIWNLYDTTTRGYDNVNEVVGPAGKAVTVTSVWYDEDEKAEYRVARFRNLPATGVSWYRDGQDISLRTPTMTQGAIERWIGMGLSVFKNTVLSVQKDLDRFLDMDPEDRKKFMIQALGLDLLIEAARLVSGDLKDRRRLGSKLDTDQQVAAETHRLVQENQDRAAADLDAFTQIYENTKDSLTTEIDDLNNRITQIDEAADTAATGLAVDLSARESELSGITGQLEDEIRKTDEQYRIIGSQVGQDQGRLRAGDSQILRLRQQITNNTDTDLDIRLARANSELEAQAEPRGPDPVNDLDLEINDLGKKISVAEGQGSALNTQIIGLKKESSRLLGLSGRCPVCRKPITAESVQDCTAEIGSQIEDLTGQKIATEKAVSEMRSVYNSLTVNRSRLLADRQTRTRERERLTGEIHSIKNFIRDRDAQVEIGKQITDLEAQKLKLTESIRINTERVAQLRTQLEYLRTQLGNRQALQAEIQRLTTEIKSIYARAQKEAEVCTLKIQGVERQIAMLNTKNGELGARLDTAQEQYAQAADKLLAIEEHIERLKEETLPLEYWERQFGTEMQIQILELVCQAIQDQANEYLLKLDCGLRFEFDIRVARGKEKLFILTQDSLGKLMAPRGRSGGEQSRLKVAIDLAMKSLSEERINLTWLDETLDGLDGSGISTVLDSVRTFGATGRRIICVSHNPKCRGFFDRVITVERRDNESRIVA